MIIFCSLYGVHVAGVMCTCTELSLSQAIELAENQQNFIEVYSGIYVTASDTSNQTHSRQYKCCSCTYSDK